MTFHSQGHTYRGAMGSPTSSRIRSKRIVVCVETADFDRLVAQAVLRGVPLAAVIREAVKGYLEAGGESDGN